MDQGAPSLPAAFTYLWKFFHQINRARPVGAGGFLPLPFSEIESWSKLYRIRLKPWEVDVILALDGIWLNVMSRQNVTIEDLRGDETDDETDAA